MILHTLICKYLEEFISRVLLEYIEITLTWHRWKS